MKSFVKQCLAITGFCAGLTILNASAIPIEIPGSGQDVPKNGTGLYGGNGNDPSDDFYRLQTVINSFETANPSYVLPTPIMTGDESLSSPYVSGMAGYDFAVVHYGAGPRGTSGGGIEVFYLNGANTFDFPANGTGPNGNGGFSSVTLFEGKNNSAQVNVPVPEGGTTGGLLAVALVTLGVAHRFVRAHC